jgi:hypothetical protein
MYHALHCVRYYRMLRVVWLGVECPARDATRGVRVQGSQKCGESTRAVRRLAIVSVAEPFVCLEGSMCRRYSRESHGGSN